MRRLPSIPALLAAFFVAGCSHAPPPKPFAQVPQAVSQAPAPLRLRRTNGVGSYMAESYEGQRTASGAIYHDASMMAAHPTLPFGTHVRVTNVTNGRSVVVTVVDRGPYRKGRVIDVSRRAARELGFLASGVAPVRIEVVR